MQIESTFDPFYNRYLFLVMELTTELRSNILILKEESYSFREIGNRLGISVGAVQRTIARHKETGSLVSKARSGRPRKTSGTTDRMMKRIITKNPRGSSTFVQAQLPHEVKIHSSTIRRRLSKDFGLPAYRSAAKPMLSPKNIRDRILFCKAHENWTSDQWSTVMFSDESMVRQFTQYAPYVRRPSNQRFNSRYTHISVKKSPSIMIWGAISCEGPAKLHFIEDGKSVNASRYINIIEEHLVYWMPQLSCTIFQQDGAPCHQAKCVKQWFQQNYIKILEPWPGSSPDLNPIENCWFLLKKKVSLMNPISIENLHHCIQHVWEHEITKDYCRELIESMPRRISAILKAKGQHTKY